MPQSSSHDKSAIIRRIVSLKQLLTRWRTTSNIPPDVPSGHIAIYVGDRFKRYIVRAKYLNHPQFLDLLEQAEEEFGFVNQGPLLIPCDESAFEEVLRCVSRSYQERIRRRCNEGSDSWPLMHDKCIY